jgi:hypothetical protein
MSELLGDNELDQHVSKQDVLKEKFGWEIPVESVPLPSKGVIYTPDSTLYNRSTLKIKAMTAHEEDILASQALIKEGSVLTHLLRSCLTDKSIDPETLILGDRNALMVSVRITGYGVDYKIRTKCQNCSHLNDVTVDLSSLEINRLKIKPLKSGQNKFKFKLPVSKKSVIFKFLTGGDDRESTAAKKHMKNVLDLKIEKNVTSYLERTIISIDDIKDKNTISHFVRNMPAYDSRSLRKYITNNEPGIKMRTEYSCNSCSHVNDTNLPITSEFFWPDT